MSDRQKIVILSTIVIVSVWTIDAFIGSIIVSRGPFWDLLLLQIPTHTLYLRLLIIASFILVGMVFSKILSRHQLSEEILRKHVAAMEASMDGIALVSDAGEYSYVNEAYAAINGFDSPEELIGETYSAIYEKKATDKLMRISATVLQKKGRWRGEVPARKKDGAAYVQELSMAATGGGNRVCVIRDITSRKKDQEKLQRSERFLSTIFDCIRDPFSIIDRNFKITRANEAYAQLKSKQLKDLLGKKCYEVLHERDSVCEDCVVEKTFQSGDPCAKDKEATSIDGANLWLEIFTYPVATPEGYVSHVVEYTRDITDRKKSEEEKKQLLENLKFLSTTDSLTGLFNRRALTDMLGHEIEKAKRYDSELSLVLCDVDRFKKINDTYGHTAGDKVLKDLSEMLTASLRKADILGRHGGDEFMLILPETSLEGAENLAEKIRSSVKKSDVFVENQKKTHISLSIGIAHFGEAAADIDSLVKKADNALYQSKQAGRNKVSVIDSGDDTEQSDVPSDMAKASRAGT